MQGRSFPTVSGCNKTDSARSLAWLAMPKVELGGAKLAWGMPEGEAGKEFFRGFDAFEGGGKVFSGCFRVQ